MSVLRHLPLLLLLPAVCGASDPNPFLSHAANRKIRPALNIFGPVLADTKSTHHLASLGALPPPALMPASLTLLPPPLPPPPPISAQALPLPLIEERPAHKEHGKSCTIVALPSIPDQGQSGGQLMLKIPQLASRCIAGIEAADDWVHIKFFNGRELHLQIDANTAHRARQTNLVFASMTDSQLISVSQQASAN